MSGAHGSADAVEAVAGRRSPVHSLDPRTKIVGLIGLAIVSVSTPPGAWAAYAAYAVLLVGLAAAARLPAFFVLRRMAVEIPFLIAAALLPFTVADGAVLGGTVASKATIGVLAMIVLSSTTPFPRLLRGFEMLRAPRTMVMIVSFMWRYLHVIGDEIRRGRIAAQARGHDPRWLGQAVGIARHIATFFVRSFERGERVYLAMVSRGYTAGMPATLGEPLVLRRNDLAFGAGLVAALATIRAGLV